MAREGFPSLRQRPPNSSRGQPQRMKFQLMVMLALAITPCRLSAEAGSAAGTNAPPKPAELVFGVRSYLVEGNDGLLPPEAIAGVLSNYTGSAVAFERLRKGLRALQLLYRNEGF